MEQVSREYELLYIISASFTDDEMAAIEGRVKAMLEKYGATVNTTTRLGKFRLAYPIKNVRHGHYIMARFLADTQAMAKIDENLRITTDVLRHLIVRADEVGSEKFDLVQFTEISSDARLEARDERQRRTRDSQSDDKTKADIKSGVAALEGEKAAEPAVKEMSAEELEKKIDTALEDNA
ncbi:30S ribosomal protein S6 [Candidatus Uhrbacteria bacterium]|nr:30S ribosomal protein S6 [Candidatus Uhrbacteria bacterium]